MLEADAADTAPGGGAWFRAQVARVIEENRREQVG